MSLYYLQSETSVLLKSQAWLTKVISGDLSSLCECLGICSNWKHLTGSTRSSIEFMEDTFKEVPWFTGLLKYPIPSSSSEYKQPECAYKTEPHWEGKQLEYRLEILSLMLLKINKELHDRKQLPAMTDEQCVVHLNTMIQHVLNQGVKCTKGVTCQYRGSGEIEGLKCAVGALLHDEVTKDGTIEGTSLTFGNRVYNALCISLGLTLSEDQVRMFKRIQVAHDGSRTANFIPEFRDRILSRLGVSLPEGVILDSPAEPSVKTKEEPKEEPYQTFFKEGDVVRISETSEYYGDSDIYNPKDTDGTILNVGSLFGEEEDPTDFNYRVKWSTGNINSYRKNDLIRAVTPAKPLETPAETPTVKTKSTKRQFDVTFKCTVVREIKRLRGTHGAMSKYYQSLDLSKQLVRYWETQFDQGHFTENRAIAFSRKPVMIHG